MNLDLQNALSANKEYLSNLKLINKLGSTNKIIQQDLKSYLKSYILSDDFKRDTVFELVEETHPIFLKKEYSIYAINKYIAGPIFSYIGVEICGEPCSFIFDRKSSPHKIVISSFKPQKIYQYFTS